jgi:hypothetical protein
MLGVDCPFTVTQGLALRFSVRHPSFPRQVFFPDIDIPMNLTAFSEKFKYHDRQTYSADDSLIIWCRSYHDLNLVFLQPLRKQLINFVFR